MDDRKGAELLGGGISVESVYGIGSTFTLRLPAGAGSRATAKLRSLQQPHPDDSPAGGGLDVP